MADGRSAASRSRRRCCRRLMAEMTQRAAGGGRGARREGDPHAGRRRGRARRAPGGAPAPAGPGVAGVVDLDPALAGQVAAGLAGVRDRARGGHRGRAAGGGEAAARGVVPAARSRSAPADSMMGEPLPAEAADRGARGLRRRSPDPPPYGPVGPAGRRGHRGDGPAPRAAAVTTSWSRSPSPPAPSSPASARPRWPRWPRWARALALWSLFLWGELVLARAGGRPFCPLGGEGDCAAALGRRRSPPRCTASRGCPWPAGAWSGAWPRSSCPSLAPGASRGGAPGARRCSRPRASRPPRAWSACSWPRPCSRGGARLLRGLRRRYVLVAGYAGIALFGWPRLGWPELKGGLAWPAARCSALAAAPLPGHAHAARTGRGVAGRRWTPRRPGRPAPATPERGPAGGDDRGVAHPGAAADAGRFAARLPRRRPRRRCLRPRSCGRARGAPVRDHGVHRRAVQPLRGAARDAGTCSGSTCPAGQLQRGARATSRSTASATRSCTGPRRDPVRCLAARAQICLRGPTRARSSPPGALFASQRTLTPEQVFELAAPATCRARSSRRAWPARDGREARGGHGAGRAATSPTARRWCWSTAARGTQLRAVPVRDGAHGRRARPSRLRPLPPPNPKAHVH